MKSRNSQTAGTAILALGFHPLPEITKCQESVHQHRADGLQNRAQPPVARDIEEDEGSERVQVRRQQSGELGGRVAIEELNALHQQRPEQLHAQLPQHLRGSFHAASAA